MNLYFQKIEMKREQPNLFRVILQKLFINRNQMPAYLVVISQCLQFLLYLPVIYRLPLATEHLPSLSFLQTNIIILLVAMLLFRVFKGISLVKFGYVLMLNYLFQYLQLNGMDASIILLITFISLFLVIDVISSMAFDFYNDNIASESINTSKILHFIFIYLGIIHSNVWHNSVIAQIISIIGFVILFFLKRASMAKSSNFKQIILRMYLWMLLSHVQVLVNNWITTPLLSQILVPLIISQLIFQIYKSRKGQIKIDQLFSQQKFLKMSFEICKYIHGNGYSQKFQKQLNNFLGDSFHSGLKQSDRKNLIYDKLTLLLGRSNQFEYQLISSQIYLFYKHQLLKSKKIIENIKRKLSFYNIIDRLLVYRVQQSLLRLYEQKNKEIHFSHYQSYYDCDQFRSLLLKASISYISVWQYSRKSEIIPQKFRLIADKLVTYEATINKMFKNIEVKCVTISLLYVSYLFEVARDITKANKVLETLAFNQDFELNFQLDQKVFIRLNLQDEPLKIERVGQNVSSLLGYQRRQLQGQKHQMLLPQFYHKSHKDYVLLFLQQQFDRLYLYNKKTLIKNKWGYYEQCNIMLRMHYNINDEIRLEGYFHIKSNQKYSWNNFMFINQNQQILECSQNFGQLMPTQNRVHSAEQYFNEPINLSQPLYHPQQDSFIQYHPLIVFDVNKVKVTYFARLVQEELNDIMQPTHQTVMKMLDSMNVMKFQWNFIKDYYFKMKESLSNIFSKQYIVLLTIGIVFLCGLFICQNFFFNAMILKTNNQNYVMDMCDNLVTYYNKSIKLGMDINYLDLNLQYGYKNSFTSVDLINQALSLQTVNQQLKSFTVKSYNLPSLIAGISYSKPNYDMVVQFLSNAYMVEQFSDDAFIRNSSMVRARISMQTIFAKSLGQYKYNYLDSIVNISQQNTILAIVTIVMVFLLLILLYLVIVRAEHKMRVNQNQTLSLLGIIHDQQELIDSTRQFISKITKQQISIYKNDYKDKNRPIKKIQNSFAPDLTATARDASRTQVSLRQISGRNLMEETFNKSLFMQTQQTNRNQPKTSFATHSLQIKLSNRNKIILLVPLLFLLIISGLTIGHHVKNNIINNLDEVNSVNNIFKLHRTSTYFSRVVVSLINLLNLKPTYNPPNTTLFDAWFATYDQKQVIITFQQAKFPEFDQFQALATQLQYQYMCSYIQCDPQFQSQINIIYTTTIQKIMQGVSAIETAILTNNLTTLKAMVTTGSLKNQLDLMIYTESVIREWLAYTYRVYIECFKVYSQNLTQNKIIFISLIIGVTVLAAIFYLVFVYYVCRNQWFLSRIANFVKTDSYINDDSHPLQHQNNNKMVATSE